MPVNHNGMKSWEAVATLVAPITNSGNLTTSSNKLCALYMCIMSPTVGDMIHIYKALVPILYLLPGMLTMIATLLSVISDPLEAGASQP